MNGTYNYITGVYSHQCVVCGNSFAAKRSDAKTCGETCRKRYSRRADEVEGWAQEAALSIRQMISHSQRYPDLQEPVRNMLLLMLEMIQSELQK